MNQNIIIYGAGGHGKVIADIIEKSGGEVWGFVDDWFRGTEPVFFGYPMLGGMAELLELQRSDRGRFAVIVAIGKNRVRKQVAEQLAAAGIGFGTAIHPSAQLGRGAMVGEGTVVMAHSVVNPGAVIGRFCIINTAATVDHDCVIEDYVHLSPGVHLGGTVTIGPLSWVGVGASVINNISIGEGVTIGAGAVVIRSIEAYSVMVGNPARLIKKNSVGG